MRRPLLLLLLLLCLFSSSVEARRPPRYCPPRRSSAKALLPPPEGCFELGAGALLWAPWLTRFQFANTLGIEGATQRSNEFYIRPGFDAGFQIFASWYECGGTGRFAQGIWTFFGHKTKFKA